MAIPLGLIDGLHGYVHAYSTNAAIATLRVLTNWAAFFFLIWMVPRLARLVPIDVPRWRKHALAQLGLVIAVQVRALFRAGRPRSLSDRWMADVACPRAPGGLPARCPRLLDHRRVLLTRRVITRSLTSAKWLRQSSRPALLKRVWRCCSDNSVRTSYSTA